MLIAAAVASAWRGRRRLLVACAPAAAAAVIWLLVHQPAYYSRGIVVTTVSVGAAGSLLLCVAVLILLARQAERPARSWLWLIGLIVVTESLPGLMPRHLLLQSWLQPALLLTMLIVPIVWIAVDARPALGLATYLALEVVTILGARVRLGGALPPAAGSRANGSYWLHRAWRQRDVAAVRDPAGCGRAGALAAPPPAGSALACADAMKLARAHWRQSARLRALTLTLRIRTGLSAA